MLDSIVVPAPPCGTEACAEKMHDLAKAGNGRNLIGMAQGIIMSRSQCGPEEAFDVLRRASQRENVKLRDLAQRMVDNLIGAGHAGDVEATR